MLSPGFEKTPGFWHSIMMIRYYSIGGLKITLECDEGPHNIFLEKALHSFSIEPVDCPDIRFRIDTTSPFPSLDSYKIIFTSNPDGLWTMLEDKDKTHYLISLQNVARQTEPYKIIRADRKFSDFGVYTRPSPENILFPLEYPLADLVVSGHININNIGIILHSACISLGGKGYLFSGVSGAGKSTISEIWQKDGEAQVLTDERVLIREYQSDLWAFGTPWHGTSVIHKNMGAPIDKIFFIKHGKENRAVPISKRDATNRLMVRCFPTFWNREGMEFAVDFCARLSREKACYELEFVNDVSVKDYLKEGS
jgi:hypothetical protein